MIWLCLQLCSEELCLQICIMGRLRNKVNWYHNQLISGIFLSGNLVQMIYLLLDWPRIIGNNASNSNIGHWIPRSICSNFCILPTRGINCLFLFLLLFSGKEVRGSFEDEDCIVAAGVDLDSCFLWPNLSQVGILHVSEVMMTAPIYSRQL